MRKALAEADQYYQAEQNGWVLYLEGSTDLAILQAFAERLGHEGAMRALERPFVHYVGNRPSEAERHYYGLRKHCQTSRAWPCSIDWKTGLRKTDRSAA